MEPQPTDRRIFSLTEAIALLPDVRSLTAGAVRRVESLAARLQKVPESHSSRGELESGIDTTVREWTMAIQGLGLEPKGLWLVDFDNGEGYYCWCYPEETVAHFHDYDGGFRGRMKIV